MGAIFEKFCTKLITNIFSFSKVGSWWYKDKKIDIVALNEKTKEIIFGECKWKEGVNGLRVVKELAEKTGYVDWFNDKRKESMVVFAKSFSKKVRVFGGARC